MLYEVYDIDSLFQQLSEIGFYFDFFYFNIILQNEIAAKYIHHKNESEEHLHPEMGN